MEWDEAIEAAKDAATKTLNNPLDSVGNAKDLNEEYGD